MAAPSASRSAGRTTTSGATAPSAGWGLSPRATYLTAAGAVVAVVVAATLSPAQATAGPVICPFRRLTGLPCPGCGMTRGWVFLMHGDLGAALAANPFALVVLPAAAALAVATAVSVVRRRPPPDVARVLRSRTARALLAAWIGFGVVRAVAVATGHVSV